MQKKYYFKSTPIYAKTPKTSVFILRKTAWTIKQKFDKGVENRSIDSLKLNRGFVGPGFEYNSRKFFFPIIMKLKIIFTVFTKMEVLYGQNNIVTLKSF